MNAAIERAHFSLLKIVKIAQLAFLSIQFHFYKIDLLNNLLYVSFQIFLRRKKVDTMNGKISNLLNTAKDLAFAMDRTH